MFLFQNSIIHRDQTGTKGTIITYSRKYTYLILKSEGEWLCSVLWSLIHAIWKRLFSTYYWGVADQIWQDCKWELLKGTLGTPDTPRIQGTLGIPAIPDTLELLDTLDYKTRGNSWHYWITRESRITGLLETPALRYTQLTYPLSICTWLLQFSKLKYRVWWTVFFFLIWNWNFLPTVAYKTQVWNKPKIKFIKFDISN